MFRLITLVGLLAAILFGVMSQISFAAPSPVQSAKTLREYLFQAQLALQHDDAAGAQEQVHQAQTLYEQAIAPTFKAHAPNTYQHLQAAFETARVASEQNNGADLALARGQIESGLMWGSYQLTTQAVQQNQPYEAETWLLLRTYRPATRFSRPNAEAMLALQALRQGQISPDLVLLRVQADLLDTYQAELNKALETVLVTTKQGFKVRQAEAVGLAQGYWQILQPSYLRQTSADTMSAQFSHLSQTLADTAQLTLTVTQIQQGLHTFRAAPLSEEEQARRAGQLLRFLALVPVEYGRGVKDGTVFLDLELQEAVTFLTGAKVAFEDLRVPLQAQQPDLVTKVSAQFEVISTQLGAAQRRENVADPQHITDQVAEMQADLQKLLPAEWQETNSLADFDVINSVLDRMEMAVKSGQYAQAETARLEAYAMFDFGPELRLNAYAPELAAAADGFFWHGYNGERGLAEAIADKATPAEITAIRHNLDQVLLTSQQTLGDGPTSSVAIIFNAAVIVFREGLEAVVILAALMASLVGGYASYRKPMIWGAVLAFVATAITWLIAQQLLQLFGHFGEKLEAVVSLVAIGVLLLITNWFFHKVYWKDWLKGFHQQKQHIIKGQAGQFISLVMLGFTSIYREGFETVLFLQALVLEAGTLTVLQGVALGLVGVGLVGILTFKLQQKLPYKKMLIVTGILIGGVLLMMVGNTVHVMQAVSWLTITPIHGLIVPHWMGTWLGLFPTWEGVMAQTAAAAFVIGSYYLAEYQSYQRKTPKSVLKSVA